MVTILKLNLEPNEYSALLKAAVIDLRNPADQARFILRSELVRQGLLQPEVKTNTLDVKDAEH
jgi:hypothetical protein